MGNVSPWEHSTAPLYFVRQAYSVLRLGYVGLRCFSPKRNFLPAKAVGFGILRLFHGIFLRNFDLPSSARSITHIGAGLPENTITYIAVYVPIRWIEWSIMAAIL